MLKFETSEAAIDPEPPLRMMKCWTPVWGTAFSLV